MSRRDVAHISGEVLRWARKRAGLELETVAQKMGKGYTAQQVEAWETGQSLPTVGQAEQLAHVVRIPFGILFMKEHPSITVPIPDLRTVSGGAGKPLSLEFFETINDCLLRQHWYIEDQVFRGSRPLPFVGKFDTEDDVKTIANDIESTVSLGDDFRRSCETWDRFLTGFIEHAESAGVLVMRNSVVRYSTKRGLSVEEFRGFAISNPLAPVVFINGRDALSAQVFTLAHELAHIWIGQSGISNFDPKVRRADLGQNVERFCNAVAAQLLIPEESLNRLWVRNETPEVNITRVATFHRVSKTAAAIRARDEDWISTGDANRIIDAETQRFADQKKRAKEAKRRGGPDFYDLFAPRNSVRLTESLIEALGQNRVFYMDAANLLGTSVGTLQKYISKLEGR